MIQAVGSINYLRPTGLIEIELWRSIIILIFLKNFLPAEYQYDEDGLPDILEDIRQDLIKNEFKKQG